VVGLPNERIRIGDQIQTCAAIEIGGAMGLIPPEACPGLKTALFSPCGCVLDTSITPAPVQSETSSPVPFNCAVCGEGYVVGLPDRQVRIGDEVQTCATIQIGGTMGLIPFDACTHLQTAIFAPCGCVLNEAATASPVTPAPVATETSSPVNGAPVPFPVCRVCGDGFEVTLLDTTLKLGEQIQTCGAVELGGQLSMIPPMACMELQRLIFVSCGCSPIGNATVPTGTLMTLAPVSYPTCPICGDGFEVTNPDVVLQLGQDESTRQSCAQVELGGMANMIPPEACSAFQNAVFDSCGCKAVAGETTAPVTAAPVSPTPTADFCNICGDGFKIGSPGQLISFIEGILLTCMELQEDSKNMSDVPCSNLQNAIFEACHCVEDTAAPVIAPTTSAPVVVAPTTSAPIAPTIAPIISSTQAPTISGAPSPSPSSGPVAKMMTKKDKNNSKAAMTMAKKDSDDDSDDDESRRRQRKLIASRRHSSRHLHSVHHRRYRGA